MSHHYFFSAFGDLSGGRRQHNNGIYCYVSKVGGHNWKAVREELAKDCGVPEEKFVVNAFTYLGEFDDPKSTVD